MATTITSYGSWGNVGMGEYRLRITLSRTSVNIANNTSTVRSRVWIEARAGGWFTNISSAHGQSIDGTQVYSGNVNRTVGQNSSTLILDNSRTVTHNAAGARTVASVGTFSNYATGNISVSTSLVLDTIPRATTPTTGGTAFVTGQAQTITLPRASTAFTHDLTYKVGTKAGTIATGAGASTSWTPGNALATEFTNSASTAITITTVTRSGSTTIGTKTNNFTLNAGTSVVPSISSVAWSDQNTKTTAIGALVQGQSRVKGVVTASGSNGSTISTRRVAVSGVTYDTDTVIDLPTSGTITATGTATDSRGKSTTANASFSVLPYDVPRLGSGGFQVQRANTSWVANDLGTNLIIDLHAIASSLKVSNVEKNLLTVSVHTRPASGGTWSDRNVINSALLYNNTIRVTGGAQFPLQSSFEVRITLNDKVVGSPTELITTIPTATVALDLNGTKVGIGKYHERGGLDVGPGGIYDDGKQVGGYVDNSVSLTGTEPPSSFPLGATVGGGTNAATWPRTYPNLLTLKSGPGTFRTDQIAFWGRNGEMRFRQKGPTNSNDAWDAWNEVGVIGRNVDPIRRGTTDQRAAATNVGFGEIWYDTNGSKHAWKGASDGTWRRLSGVMAFPAAAWASIKEDTVGRTIGFTIPTVIETSETIAITALSVGTGYGFIAGSSITPGVTSTGAAIRFMQINAQTTQGLTITWQIIDKGI